MKIPRIIQLPSGAYFCRIRVDGNDIPITDYDRDKVEAMAYAYKSGLIQAKKKPQSMTLAAAIDKYIADRENILAMSTIRMYKQVRANRFQSLMHKNINNITENMLQKEINLEAKRYNPKTVKNSFGLIRSALHAQRVDLEWDRILLPQQRKPESKTPTPAQLKELCKQIKGTDLELPVLLAAWLSLRREEIYGLEKRDFDTVDHIVKVRRAFVYEGNPDKKRTATKTYASARNILSDPYISELAKKLPDGPIVHKAPQNLLRDLKLACAEAGIPETDFRSLRHFNASMMATLGIANKYSMARGGWTSEKTMREVYQEIMDEGVVNAANKINDYMNSIIS